jgi:hypothetical protein
MAKQSDPSPINTGLMIGVIKSFIGDFSVEVNRIAELVTIKARGQEYIYTYEQLVDELEKMLNGEQPEKQG